MARILIVEDDMQISKSLAMNLRFSGYEIQLASSVLAAWKLLNQEHFDLICLDIGLPDGSGLELCQKIRGEGNEIPILFISARTDEATVVKGINAGGDDYLRKPFGMEELKVRMNKMLKRFTFPTSIITFGKMTVDPVRRMVTVMDEIVILGRKELEILILLIKSSGNVVTRELILETLYENADMYDRTVDSHMSHLRKKIREVAGATLQINSVYGLGYRLEWKKA